MLLTASGLFCGSMHQGAIWIALLFAIWSSAACSQSGSPTIESNQVEPLYFATPAGDGVRVEFRRQKDVLYAEVFSQSGIGSAVLVIPSDKRPDEIILQFHLGGLEQLWLKYAEINIQAFVMSTPPYETRQSIVLEDGGEADIEPSSPYWMDISIELSEPVAEPKIPLKDGIFAVTVPEDFIRNEYERLTVSWIDFYR